MKKGKLLLINPWQSYPRDLESEYQSFFPYGLTCIGAIGLREGYETKIVDCLADDIKTDMGNFVRFGKTKEELSTIIKKYHPDIVGISSLFSMFEKDATEVAKLVKTIDKNIVVILGGVTATLEDVYKPLLKLDCYDIMCRGEGEYIFRDLLRNYDSVNHKINNLDKILGIAFKNGDEIIITPQREFISDLDSLPMPAFELLDIKKTLSNKYYSRWRNNPIGKKVMPMFTSRGCPYNCTFCSVHSQVGYKFRTYSTNYVISIMKKCIEEYGVNHFHLEDDNLTLNRARAKAFFRELKKLNITWDTPNGVRADTLDEEMLTLMKESGLTSISIAAESGNEYVRLNIIKKMLKDSSIINAAKMCDDLDIPCIVFFVLGFPKETLAQIKDSVSFAKKLAVKYNTINTIYVANPLPGTELSKEAIDKGYIKKDLDCTDYFEAIRINKNSIIETEEFDKKKIFELLKEELNSEEFSLHNPSIPMFWANQGTAHTRAKRAFPRISNHSYVWEWKEQEL